MEETVYSVKSLSQHVPVLKPSFLIVLLSTLLKIHVSVLSVRQATDMKAESVKIIIVRLPIVINVKLGIWNHKEDLTVQLVIVKKGMLPVDQIVFLEMLL